MQAFEIEVGKTFRWQNDVYRVQPYEGDVVPDTIPVIRVAGLWPKYANPWLEFDTWMPVTSQQIENFNSHANVVPVIVSIFCHVREIEHGTASEKS